MNKYLISLVSLLMLLLMLFATLFAPTKIQVVNGLSIQSRGMVVIDAESKRVLEQKDKDLKLPMASTTKIMTCILAIENTQDLNEKFVIDKRAVGIEGTSIYLREGEELTMEELLYGLMLASGNDAALAIAYRVGDGSMEKFVDMMNDKVAELGLTNTHFDNPHGLDSSTHYTSAYDLACITAYAMKNETFCKIVSTKFKQISSIKEVGNRFLRNKHRLLQGDFEGCEGVKTGFTDNARRCCVTSVMRNGFRVICVVLNCNDMFEESAQLINKVYNEYQNTEILEPYNLVTSIMVENGEQDKVKLYYSQGFYYPLKQEELSKIYVEKDLPESLKAPIEKDAEVGKINIYFENKLIFSQKIYTMEDVKSKELSTKIKDIIENWY